MEWTSKHSIKKLGATDAKQDKEETQTPTPQTPTMRSNQQKLDPEISQEPQMLSKMRLSEWMFERS